MGHPLSGCAASPSFATREGDDALTAGRPLLGVPELGRACFVGAVSVRFRAHSTFSEEQR